MHAILKNTCFVCVFGLFTSGPATAHGNLVSTTPAVDTVVSVPPTELELKFSEALDVEFSGVKIIGPGNATISTGDVFVANANILIVPIMTTLVAGTYSVHWHLLSTDGHRAYGDYTFAVNSQ